MKTVDELLEMNKQKKYKDIIPHLELLSDEDKIIFINKSMDHIKNSLEEINTESNRINDTLYKLYLNCPLATPENKHNSVLYDKLWCVQTGMAFMHPHPHRYFTKEEFLEKLDTDDNLLEYLAKVYNVK